MDFDTSSSGNGRGRRRPSRDGGLPDFSTGAGDRPRRTRRGKPDGGIGDEREFLRIPAGSRKAALVYLALAAWREDLLDPKDLGEVRGRSVDEAGLQRALYRSSMGEIEHLLGPAVKGKLVVVEGRLAGTGRTALERLGGRSKSYAWRTRNAT